MLKEMQVTVLAKGAPVKCSSGEISMCAIALGDVGLIRLYPLTVTENKDVCVWSKIVVKVRRSNKDPRHESWRSEYCEAVGSVSNAQDKSQILNDCILKSGTTDPIAYQNENRSSIAVIKSSQFLGAGLLPRQPEDYHDFDEQESWVMTQDNYPFKPYLFWKSIQGGEHKTHIVAQEVYVGMKNFCSTPFRVFENMHIGDPDYEHWMILGNMKDRRNVWVCPHLHRLKKNVFRYQFKLNDERWEQRRMALFAARGQKCERCGSTIAISVHHRRYDLSKQPWEYLDIDLEILCKHCHEKEHEKTQV